MPLEVMTKMEEWLTAYEAARVADLDPDYIRKLARAEKILDRQRRLT